MMNTSEIIKNREFSTSDLSAIAEKESWRKEVNRPIYHIHKWWATRLGSIFRAMGIYAFSETGFPDASQLYNKYDFSNKIILDPFMGSGTTLGELTKLGAKCVGSDINPISNFLVHQEFTRVSIPELITAYNRIERKVSQKILSYYKTKSNITGGLIPVLYYLWVKWVKTPEGEEIPLFTSYIISKDAYPSKKPEAQAYCPNCANIFRTLYNSVEVQCPRCKEKFNPQIGTCNANSVNSKSGAKYKIKDLIQKNGFVEKIYAIVALDDQKNKCYLPVSQYDLDLYEKANCDLEEYQNTFKLPTMRIDPGINTDQAIEYGYEYWVDLFNSRQKLCLGILLNAILEETNLAIQEQLLCLFSSTLEFNNMFCSYKGEGTGAVRPIFSNHILKPEKLPLENSIWGLEQSSGCFSSLFKSRLIKAKEYLDKPFELTLDSKKIICSNPIDVHIYHNWDSFVNDPKGLLLFNTDSSNISIPSKSIDAIITDPPYFDFINYSELSDFFYAWLSKVLCLRYKGFNADNSRRAEEVQNSDPLMFSKAITNVFIECYRVLIDEGIMEFTFHHSSPSGWAAISTALINSGFYVEQVAPVHGELRCATPKSGTNEPISLDMLILCKKFNDTNEIYVNPADLFSKYITNLTNVGMKLSKTDHSVIASAIALIDITNRKLNYDEALNILDGFF